MDLGQAKKIMGKNFIGPVELGTISSKLGITDPVKSRTRIPKIPFTEPVLKKNRKLAVLLLGIPRVKNGKPLTLNIMRSRFGIKSKKADPCFYNQDWYIRETFAEKRQLKLGWYLVSKKIALKTRGQNPDRIKKSIKRSCDFPSAILAAFTFFAYYFHTKGSLLWRHDFIWCSDADSNGDQIYVGRYQDPKGKSRKGFNVHRHLRIRSNYGLAPVINQ